METETKTELIAEFMGGVVTYLNHCKKLVWVFPFRENGSDVLLFDTSWDWIIPVCLKWDSIPFGTWNKAQRKEYDAFTARIEQTVLLYDSPEEVSDILAEAIKWYNNQKENGNRNS